MPENRESSVYARANFVLGPFYQVAEKVGSRQFSLSKWRSREEHIE